MRGIGHLILVLASICFVAAFALAAVFEVTKEPIAYQIKLEVIRSLKAVLPDVEIDPDKLYLDLASQDGGLVRVYRAPGKEGFAGAAFQVTAPDGYSGNIGIMIGVLPDGTLGGIEILTHAETPGLGSLIVNPAFKTQFRGLSLENSHFQVKKDGGNIDQITGATISPRAVASAVKKGLEWFQSNRDRILSEEGESS